MTAIQMAPLLQNQNSSTPTVPSPAAPQLSERTHVARAMPAIKVPPSMLSTKMIMSAPPPPTPPSPAVTSHARRNLFGSPKPGEIKDLLAKEQQAQFEKLKKEYNISKESLEILDKCNKDILLANNNNRHNSISTPLHEKKTNCVVAVNKVEERLTHLEREERSKPYGRQTSIKDYNRVRKSLQRRQETTPPNVPRCITSVAKTQQQQMSIKSMLTTSPTVALAATDIGNNNNTTPDNNTTSKFSGSDGSSSSPLSAKDKQTTKTTAVATAAKLTEQA